MKKRGRGKGREQIRRERKAEAVKRGKTNCLRWIPRGRKVSAEKRATAEGGMEGRQRTE